MELSIQKSSEQAEIISSIVLLLYGLDVPYLRHFANTLNQQANQYDSMAALNRNWKASKSQLMAAQAKAITCLCDYKDALQAIDKLKVEVAEEDEQNHFIDKLFGIS